MKRRPRLSDVDHRLTEASCPLCGHKLDAASGIDSDDSPSPGDASPPPGDASVCIQSAPPLVFTETLSVRAMTRAELHDLHPENRQQLEMMMQAVRSIDRRKTKKSP